jgi:hypothetical protein
VTGPVPPAAAAQDALALVLQAAGHPLLGDMALHQGTVYAGAPTSLQDRALITGSGDQSWRRTWALFLDGSNAGQERFIQSVDGQQGLLRWQPPLDFALAQGAAYVLFRDYRFNQWLAWLNETARNLHYPLDVYAPVPDDPATADGASGGRLRYTVPEPIRRAGWLSEVLIGPATVSYTSPEARSVRWYHVNPLNVEGDLYLVLSRPLSRSQHLLFRARPPFAFEDQTPYTTLSSPLWPAGLDVATASAVVPPVRLFVLGTVWRSLQQKVTNLTGQPRVLWTQNLERCARQYAQACAEWGPKEMGWELGFHDDWYPTATHAWTLP